MVADAVLVAGKDLRLEWKSRVAAGQVLPFALIVLVLFAFAIDPSRGVLERVAPGLYWVAVLLAALLAIGRSHAVDAAPGVRDAMRLSGLDPAGIFLGKAAAVAVQLAGLQVVLAVGIVVLYDVELTSYLLLASTALATTVAVAAAGTVHGVLAAGLRVRETLLPLLLLPALAPVLIAATSATEAALDGVPGEGWGWTGLLAVFALLYLIVGTATYGVLLEDQ